MYTIYKYTNLSNGKVYIGQTSKTLEERALTNGINYRECRRFYAAIKKYSWSSFVPEVLEVVDDVRAANEREIYYIDLYDSTNPERGYNIASGGDNKEMSEETKAIISRKAKERYQDPTLNPMYGKHHSDSTIKKQSECKLGAKNPMYGTKWTDRQRLLCGTKGKRLNITDDHRKNLRDKMPKLAEARRRKVLCIEDNTTFDSLTDAANTYGVSVSTLCGHLTNKQHVCAGKHFKYIS